MRSFVLAGRRRAGPLTDGLSALDRRWAERIVDRRSGPRDTAALTFDRTGRGVVRAATLTAVGLELARRRHWSGLAAFGLAEAATPASVNLAKLLVNRRRPPGASIKAFGTSFPSGHTAYAAATSVALVLLHDELGETQRRAAWIAAGAGTIGMAWSRTYLQLHWLTDVAAGGLLGAGVTVAMFEIVKHRTVGRRV